MRKVLLESFNKIYILDLHGNAKRKEKSPDGSKDENVFDIQQGVSINIFIKSKFLNKKELGKIFHFDLFGLRDFKYKTLFSSTINTISFENLKYQFPYNFFVPKFFNLEESYNKFFYLADLMNLYVSGFQTKRDKVTIQFDQNSLISVRNTFINNDCENIRKILGLPEDGRDWRIEWAKNDLIKNNPKIVKIMYRPFDDRYTYYTGKSKGFVAYPRDEMYTHLNRSDNFSLISCRQQSSFDFQHVFVSRLVSDMCNISSQTKETGYIYPLYLYHNETELLGQTKRIPNLKIDIITPIALKLSLQFIKEKDVSANSTSEHNTTFAPIDILDYIYAVLHSPTYRTKYKEFLKIDFPRVPYPKDADTFWQLVKLGGVLRQIHLLESPVVNKFITTYPVNGLNEVTKLRYEDGRVWINNEQYFDKVPRIAWEFYIGGYQPAQKWLKDRKGRKLSFEDIMHYQKIIVALAETDRIMKEVNEVGFMEG